MIDERAAPMKLEGLMLVLALAGCGDGSIIGDSSTRPPPPPPVTSSRPGVNLLPLGTVDTAGGSQSVAFVPLADSDLPDIVVESPSRGELDVLVADRDGFRLFGSFFSGGPVAEMAQGHLAGRSMLVLRLAKGANGADPYYDSPLVLLGADANAPHRLTFPFPLKFPGYLTAEAMAVGDVDGDGTSDLVAALGAGVVAVRELAKTIGVFAEKAPSLVAQVLDRTFAAAAVAVTDLDGDGLTEIVAVGRDAPVLRAFRYSLDFKTVDTQDLVLPAPGRMLVATGCPDRPLLIVLATGQAVLVDAHTSTVDPLATALPVQVAASERGAVLLMAGSPPELALFDPCMKSNLLLPKSELPQQLALASSDGAFYRLALLSPNQQRVSLFGMLRTSSP